MTGPIDHSVTLEDVFAVVNTKRVPLAPELAGYLTLEIAEGAQQQGGEVDPRSVFVGEEGTVALVRAKDAGGDAEASVRGILLRLLEASGSQTPALGAAARRRPGSGLPGLVEELEAALIPVNRAAGRRALARLAREVKRVTLGVGRNAAPPERPGPPRPNAPPPRAPQGAMGTAPFVAPVPPAAVPAPPAESGRGEPSPEPPDLEPFPDLELILPRGPSSPPKNEVPTSPPKPNEKASELPTVNLKSDDMRAILTPAQLPEPGSVGGDAVDQLLASFEVSGATTDRAVSRELKTMVGLEPTPPPPHTPGGSSSAPAGAAKGEGEVEQLLALSDQSIPIANMNVRRPQTPPLVLEPPPMPPAPPPSAPRVPPAQPVHRATPPQPPPQSQAHYAPPQRPPAPQAPLQHAPPSAPAPQYAPPQQHGPPPQHYAPPHHHAPPQHAAPAVAQAAPPVVQHVAPPAHAVGSRHAKTVVVRDFRRPRAARVDRILAFLTLLVLVGGAVAVWMLKPGFFTGRTPDKLEQERQAAAAASLAALAQQQQVRCRATLAIADVPPNAEVLMRVGQAPVDIDRMPVGARLEFVATAEGFAPKRSIIPAGASWDPGPDGKPRYELAVQLDPTKARPGAVDPWPAGEPGSVVGGKGSPGTVHVVSTPRAAEMWLLVGAGPDATIDPVKCEQDAEILVAGPTTFRKRLKISAADIGKAPVGQSGAHVLRLSAK